MIRVPNPCFSAALAAYVEAHYDDEAEKNRLCDPPPLADTPAEWLVSTLGNMKNQLAWSQDRTLRAWITDCRLDGFGKLIRDADKTDPAVMKTLTRMREAPMPAAMNLQKLISA